jgi:L-threonylcarbamoyladenylate synthase
MVSMFTNNYLRAVKLLKEGKVGVIPADTVYGISCLASDPLGVARIYEIKGRDHNKPFIILIPSVTSLRTFGIDIENTHLKQAFEKHWPGPTSLVLNCPNPELEYLHRGLGSLAFRLPDDTKLLELLRETGPIVSTSANPSEKSPATTPEQAQKIFGSTIDFYLGGGVKDGTLSRVIKIDENGEQILRGN